MFGTAEKNHRLEQINIVVGREAKGARAVVTKKIRIIYPLTNSCDSTDIIKGKRKKERKEGREGGRRQGIKGGNDSFFLAGADKT